MKRIFLTFLIITLLSITASAANNITFSDLPESHWAHSTVMPMVERGLFNGTSAAVNGVGTFSPDKPMTRAEFIAVICREFFPGETYVPSPDIPWWDPYFTVAVLHDLIDYQYEFIHMDVEMTRAEAALLITRALERVGTPLKYKQYQNVPDCKAIEDYDDSVYGNIITKGTISSAVYHCIGSGIIGGIDKNGTFDPYGKLTRAAAATILCRMTDEGKRIKTAAMNPVDPKTLPEVQEHLKECAKGNHYYVNYDYGDKTTVSGKPLVEEIRRATVEEEGLYRVNCKYCDHSVEVPFRKHDCYGDILNTLGTIHLKCGDNYWNGDNCHAGTPTGLINANASPYGYTNELYIKCQGIASCVGRCNSTMEEATHEFSEWGVVTYPGRGVEGRLERRCAKCGFYNYKALPMYSTVSSSLDVRNSYTDTGFGTAALTSDVFPWKDRNEVKYERVKADFSKGVEDNVEIFNTFVKNEFYDNFFLEGVRSYSIDRYLAPRLLKFIEGKYEDRFGINVFTWREKEEKVSLIDLGDMRIAFEAFYFVTEDREIAHALWWLTDKACFNGIPDDSGLKGLGFKVLKRTADTLELEIKGLKIHWQFGDDINGYNFFFGK